MLLLWLVACSASLPPGAGFNPAWARLVNKVVPQSRTS